MTDKNRKGRELGSSENSRDGKSTPKDGKAGKRVEPANRQPISERKLRANQANAKKSTGPRTDRGKYYSRRNAQTHRLYSRTVLFRPDGTPIDPELQAVWSRLREQHGKDDGGRDELLQEIVAEWWHQRRATDIEESFLQNALVDSGSDVSIDKLQRHNVSSQRALLKLLTRLRKLTPTTSRQKATNPEEQSEE